MDGSTILIEAPDLFNGIPSLKTMLPRIDRAPRPGVKGRSPPPEPDRRGEGHADQSRRYRRLRRRDPRHRLARAPQGPDVHGLFPRRPDGRAVDVGLHLRRGLLLGGPLHRVRRQGRLGLRPLGTVGRPRQRPRRRPRRLGPSREAHPADVRRSPGHDHAGVPGEALREPVPQADGLAGRLPLPRPLLGGRVHRPVLPVQGQFRLRLRHGPDRHGPVHGFLSRARRLQVHDHDRCRVRHDHVRRLGRPHRQHDRQGRRSGPPDDRPRGRGPPAHGRRRPGRRLAALRSRLPDQRRPVRHAPARPEVLRHQGRPGHPAGHGRLEPCSPF